MEFLLLLLVSLFVLFIIGQVFLWSLGLIGRLFGINKSKPTNKTNPYIESHRAKFKNDDDYEEYLNWLSKQGGDIPINKKMSAEEKKFLRELNKKKA